MTRHTTTELIEQEYIESVTCDICKRRFDDELELSEFINFHFIAGYGSVFGDGTEVDIDICQYCLKKLIGEYICQR